MTKEDIVAKIAGEVGISKAKAAKALAVCLDGITNALRRGDKVTFVGFGTFTVAHRVARKGRNPRTGEVVNIPAARVPKFKPGVLLRHAVGPHGPGEPPPEPEPAAEEEGPGPHGPGDGLP